MVPLSGSCIPLKVSLRVIKKVFLFFRVIIEYRELDTPRNRAIMERYNTLVTTHYKGPDRMVSLTTVQGMYKELCEDDYSDAEEELEANLDTD